MVTTVPARVRVRETGCRRPWKADYIDWQQFGSSWRPCSCVNLTALGAPTMHRGGVEAESCAFCRPSALLDALVFLNGDAAAFLACATESAIAALRCRAEVRRKRASRHTKKMQARGIRRVGQAASRVPRSIIPAAAPAKIGGFELYKALGSPKYLVSPMVRMG